MKKFKLKTSFILLIAAVIVAVVLINLIAATLGEKLPLKADMSANKVYSLSEETIKALKAVDRDVYVYYLVTSGNENMRIKQTIDMYKGYNDKIHFEQVDPSRDPVFAKNIGVEVSENSVIVKSGDRVKAIDSSVVYDSTYSQYGIVEFSLEQKLTLAIDYVLRSSDTTVLFTKGHEEIGFEILKSSIEEENATPSEIDLKTSDIPEDTAALYIISPQRDFSADEIEKIHKYLEGGGSLNVSIDYDVTETPVLRQYLSEYWGINFLDNIVLETDENRYSSNNPYILIPVYGSHNITSRMSSSRVNILWPSARGIEILEKPGVTTVPLLKSSEKTVAKPSSEAGSFDVSEADVVGEATLATVTEYLDTAARTRTRIISTGSSFYLLYLREASVANADFVHECLNYLRGEERSLISPKNVQVQYMTLTQQEIILYRWIYGILPPLLVFVAGIFVWVRRRHK
jgi:ABC-2 type transport system permease protein